MPKPKKMKKGKKDKKNKEPKSSKKGKKHKLKSKGQNEHIETHFKENHLTPSMRRQLKIESEFNAPHGCWNQTKDQHWYGCSELTEDNEVINNHFNEANRGVLYADCPPRVSKFPVHLKKYIATDPFRKDVFFETTNFVTFKFGVSTK
jgi:hypothetical protein